MADVYMKELPDYKDREFCKYYCVALTPGVFCLEDVGKKLSNPHSIL